MNTPLKSTPPSAEHLAFRRALEATMREHVKTLGAMDVLAILSHLVGQVIALQDQRVVTPEIAMDVVVANVRRGNDEVLQQLLSETGGSA